jgi:hypothetical protein
MLFSPPFFCHLFQNNIHYVCHLVFVSKTISLFCMKPSSCEARSHVTIHSFLCTLGFMSVSTISRKVAGSTDRSLDLFSGPDPSSRTVAPGSTQHLTEMRTRKVKGGRLAPSVSRLFRSMRYSLPSPQDIHRSSF